MNDWFSGKYFVDIQNVNIQKLGRNRHLTTNIIMNRGGGGATGWLRSLTSDKLDNIHMGSGLNTNINF